MKEKKIPEIYSKETLLQIQGDIVNEHHFYDYDFHRHDYYEFEFIVDGCGESEINGEKVSINPGDIVYVTPLDFHSYTCKEEFKTITVYFDSDTVDRELATIFELSACVVKSTDELKEAFHALAREKSNREYGSFAQKNLIERIVVLFLRLCKNSKRVEYPKQIISAVGYINRYYNKDITLETVSQKIGYSPAYFCRQFKKYTGMSFVEYITDVRISHVRNLLMHRDAKITELCHECGFGSLRSLSRAFLKKYGMSPKEYKRQNMS